MLKLQDVTPRMNFLDVQTSDALVMLVSVQTAAQETLSLLQELHSQALAAANGTVGSDELARMNRQFQALIQLFPYFQSIYTINGPKLLSGGNVHLQFGKESRADAVYDIKIPAFTAEALGLNNLSLDSQTNAMDAVNALYLAEQTVNAVLMSTGTGYLTDAQTMVYELGFMLQSHFTILGAMQTLSMEAAQYVCVGGMSEHPLFNIEADYLKALMQKNQSYLSLNGVVNEGYGDLTIQIGSEVSPKTTLTLQIPVTNASMTGMSDLQLDDCELALAALRQTNAVMTAFAYGAKA